MAERRFNIVFTGKLAEGITPQEALKRLCVELNQEEAAVRELFKGGFGAVIFTNMEGQQAYAVRDRLRDAGAHCSVQEVEPPPAPEALSGSMLTMESSRTTRPGYEQPSVHHRPRPAPAQPPTSSGSGGLLVKLLLLAALAAGCWWGYQHWIAPAG